ncbi:peroxidase family protein [Nonomuraea sp. M3C6]|uniref:Peroxidase family protein n=1 Tax=Nonomuraea marmarensis TaxID=3351344 RepID=A0ABW7AK85_9ACTN
MSAPRRPGSSLRLLFDRVAERIDRAVGWHRLPLPLGLAVLIGLRDRLRDRNLHDTSGRPAIDPPPVGPPQAWHATARTPDGTYNDLARPAMGMAGARFGRNVPLDHTHPETLPELLEPSPREISRAVLTRREFQPATSVNALVAAWLQFMIRDWFSHGEGPRDGAWTIPLADDDPWPEPPMTVLRTRPDPTRPPGALGRPATWANTQSHWWDASQVYGTNAEEQRLARSGHDGKLRLTPDGLIPYPTGEGSPARMPGFWLGLAMMQTLFAREHNAICDRLRAEYPSWDDDDLFGRARLINAALIAKIHTVEWTPAVISHPTTRYAMRANWWGLTGERLYRLFGRISDSEIISGIPGSPTRHHGVPFAITEEFVAVYRMHPLVPDHYAVRAAADDRLIEELTFRDIAGPAAIQITEKLAMTDLLYSFGTAHPGLVTLRNFPRFLQEFERPDGRRMDLAAVDILRTRELGVPRYNEFRRLLGLRPAGDFDDLTEDRADAAELRRLYRGDIESVDLMVGMYAEPRPAGFAFSDTAFRIFILMASRRLNSDRFFTTAYTPQVYTRAGLDWINDNTMATVLLRHHPHLRSSMHAVTNAFEPWRRSTS